MFNKTFKVETKADLTIQLPEECLHKEVKIITIETGEDAPDSNHTIIDFSDAEAFFSKFNIDMSQFKFDRDEANER